MEQVDREEDGRTGRNGVQIDREEDGRKGRKREDNA